jgi:hypothetical protein
MTLMELVIGLAITGMMAAVGAGAFSSIVDHRKTIAESAITTERAGAQREMIRSWIYAGNIQLQRGGGPRGLQRGAAAALGGGASRMNNVAAVSAAQAAGDELIFQTNAINPSLLGNVRIRMYVDADANTPETGLTIEYQPSAQLPLVRKMLDSAIDTLKVEYLDARTNRWFPATETATIQPKAARVWFHSTDPKSSPIVEVPMLFVIGNTNGTNFNFNFNFNSR